MGHRETCAFHSLPLCVAVFLTRFTYYASPPFYLQRLGLHLGMSSSAISCVLPEASLFKNLKVNLGNNKMKKKQTKVNEKEGKYYDSECEMSC